MKNESTPQDKLFKEKLYHHTVEPLPSSWGKISNKLDALNVAPKHRSLLHKIGPYAIAATVSLIVIATWFIKINEQSSSIATTSPTKKTTEIESPPSLSYHEQVSKPIANPHSSETTISKTILKTTDTHKKTLLLPDGSRVILNRNSEISYENSFTAARTVHVKGQAYFDITHDSAHPFIVYGNLSKTQVLGTAFTLRSYSNERYDELNVSRGKVSFEKRMGDPEKMIILAGNKAIISDQELRKEAISDINYDAWQTEKIVFDQTPLKDVFSTLEDYYQISISTATPEILNCRFTGVFEQSKINEVLQVLSVSFNLSYNEDSQHYILSGKGCK